MLNIKVLTIIPGERVRNCPLNFDHKTLSFEGGGGGLIWQIEKGYWLRILGYEGYISSKYLPLKFNLISSWSHFWLTGN